MRKALIPIVLIALLAVIVVSIVDVIGLWEPDISSTPTPTPTATPTAIRTEASCIRVIDGDTIKVVIDGETYKVRYIGMDTPEMDDSRPDVRALAEEATYINRGMVEGITVELEKDVSETDKYGRLLRYVYIGNTFVNAELVALGYAQVATYPPDVKYEDLF